MKKKLIVPRISIVLFIAAFLPLSASLYAQAPDAAAVIRNSRDRIKADTVMTQSRMVLTAKNGSTSERMLVQYSKDGAKGNRTVVVFQRPASVANTRFLTMENPGRADDRWIFLPSLGKVRRIAASEGSGSFMGTDLSYDDVSSQERNADLDTHRILREEALNGKSCYVIESIPRDSSYQYGKMLQWIDKSNSVNYRIELYDKKGNQVKFFETLELKDVQGRLTPMVTKMTTINAGTSTTITVERIQYDGNIPEKVFTVDYLETGNARG
ncbi:MAG: outer membrane lipoprotein-sorting protein [Treponema sp.]|jgi:outer membrane lipoprotein-sorting protein|nr:outer membrane lipoprotein-sorting protein [Treponema sp.]